MAWLSFDGSPHGGKHKKLPEADSQPHITPTTIIDHSIVGSAAGAWFMFRDSTGIESHFIIDLNGEIWQLMDTGRQADANLNANSFGISIETADNGNPNDFPWTNAQLASLKWLHNKLRAVHPTIPRKECMSSFGGGLGFHSKFPPGTANPWSPVMKTCPGKPARMAQWEDILLPAFVSGTVEEDDMALDADDKKWLNTLAENVARRTIFAVMTGGTGAWSNPEREGWEFYTPAVQQSALEHLRNAAIVPGTTTPDEAFNILFARVRKIEDTVEKLTTAAIASAVVDELASRSQQ